MKKHKKLIITIISIILVLAIGSTIYLLLRDENRLTIKERNWVDENINTIQNVNVKNNINVFGKDGVGVFYDFLNDFSKKYNLQINPITFTNEDSKNGLTFGVKTNINDYDLVMYKDHYVLLGKNYEIINNIEDLAGKKIGVLSKDLEIVSNYLNGINDLALSQYETKDTLKEAFNEEISYVICPLIENLDEILL